MEQIARNFADPSDYATLRVEDDGNSLHVLKQNRQFLRTESASVVFGENRGFDLSLFS